MEQIEAAVNATAMMGEANPGAGVVADAAEREGIILAEAEAEAEAQVQGKMSLQKNRFESNPGFFTKSIG